MISPMPAEIRDSGRSEAFSAKEGGKLSVLLPTYNRVDALARTLNALQNQTLAADLFEIVVVDDGSSDSTAEFLKDFAGQTVNRFCYAVLADNGGPARARNAGLAMVRCGIVLIIGDDIEPDNSLLEKHLSFHKKYPDGEFALLGHVSFPQELTSTSFMHWLEADGRRYFFNYAELQDGEEAKPIFFYTCNVSVKMALLDKSGWFDESFPYASHEDLELGYRLADKGMRLVYDSTARGYHWHTLTIQGIARRVYLMGYSAEIFWQAVSERGSVLKQFARNSITVLCSLPPVILLWEWLRNKEYQDGEIYALQWKLLLFLGFFIGLGDSKSRRKIRV
jgi:glycosyltransferase involved in cell wall biosynthesis